MWMTPAFYHTGNKMPCKNSTAFSRKHREADPAMESVRLEEGGEAQTDLA